MRERGGTDLEIEIVKAYFDLDKDSRLATLNYFIDRLTAAKAKAAETKQATVRVFAAGQKPDMPPSDLESMTTEQLEALYEEQQYKNSNIKKSLRECIKSGAVCLEYYRRHSGRHWTKK